MSIQENNENKIINLIQIENYKSNDIELNNKKEFQNSNEKIKLMSQENINIYDNNNNHIVNLKQKVKTKGKAKIKFNNHKDNNAELNLYLEKTPLKNNNFNGIKNNIKNDSMIINNNNYSNLNLNNYSINSFISSPISKYKVNISIIKNEKKEGEKKFIQNKSIKKIRNRKSCFLYTSNLLKSFPYVLKKSKLCQSVKLNKKYNIENIKLFLSSKLNISSNNNSKKIRKRNYTNDLNDNLNYTIKNNTTFITHNSIKVQKKDFITFSPKESMKQSKVIVNKKYNKLPLTTIGKKLYNTNNNKTFLNNSQNTLFNFPREKNKDGDSKNLNNKSLLQKCVNSNNIIVNIKNNADIIKKLSGEIKKKESNDINDFEVEIENEEESENKIINDSKSIISNYIASPLLNNQDIQSCAISLFSKNI